MTGLLALIANTMHRPDHGLYILDTQLIQVGMDAIDNMAAITKTVAMDTFRTVSNELFHNANHRHSVAIGAYESPDIGSSF
jgi:hypothetical protein